MICHCLKCLCPCFDFCSSFQIPVFLLLICNHLFIQLNHHWFTGYIIIPRSNRLLLPCCYNLWLICQKSCLLFPTQLTLSDMYGSFILVLDTYLMPWPIIQLSLNSTTPSFWLSFWDISTQTKMLSSQHFGWLSELGNLHNVLPQKYSEVFRF